MTRNYLPHLILIACISQVLPGCKVDEPKVFFPGIADRQLKKVADSAISTANIKNTTILVDSPKQNYRWSTARGIANPNKNTAMTSNMPFRIASVTKTFTATIILKMMEQGLLELESTIGDILVDTDMPPGFTVSELHQIDGTERGTSITIRQLLSHTSGLRDYAFDNPSDDPSDLSLTRLIVGDVTGNMPSGISKKQWSADELLRYFFESGMAENSVAIPGEQYHYSDTNYVLLGIIIEKLMHNSLADNYRNFVYGPLQMDYAHLDWYEPAPIAGPVHHYWEIIFPGQTINADVIGREINTSTDWGGGGIVANVFELNDFIRALFNLNLFSDKSTLKTMQTTAPTGESNKRYGLGLQHIEYTISNKKINVYGHSGLWGVGVYYIPDTKTSIVYSMNQVELKKDWLLEILKALDKAKLFSVI